MKKVITGLFVISLIAGCATTPSSPKPQRSKYAFQCLQVSIPDDVFQTLTFSASENLPLATLSQPQIEEVISHPDATILEYPIVYAGIGASVTNDQTKTVEMAVDADIVDGKVVYKKEPQKLGKETSITIDQVQGNTIKYKINAMYQELTHFEDYKTKEGLEVRLPYFKKQGIDTKLTQALGSWLMLGGSVNQIDDGPKTHEMTFIRVMPPEEKL